MKTLSQNAVELADKLGGIAIVDFTTLREAAREHLIGNGIESPSKAAIRELVAATDDLRWEQRCAARRALRS